jgi:hypothetical protein
LLSLWWLILLWLRLILQVIKFYIISSPYAMVPLFYFHTLSHALPLCHSFTLLFPHPNPCPSSLSHYFDIAMYLCCCNVMQQLMQPLRTYRLYVLFAVG